jgi:hypothetical protein
MTTPLTVDLEARVPQKHPLGVIRDVVNNVLIAPIDRNSIYLQLSHRHIPVMRYDVACGIRRTTAPRTIKGIAARVADAISGFRTGSSA